MGKLIVLEGLDGSGKSTQLELLEEALKGEKVSFETVSFPAYELDSCAPVKMYLAGEFGINPDDVNAFAASTFYAVDRYASYKKNWGRFYENDGLILAGRYTTSNAIHQTSKLERKKWEDYLNWLFDFEYNKFEIPKPDLVIYLNVPIDASQKLLTGRYDGNEEKKDIHEKNTDYLNRCRIAAQFVAQKFGWTIVECYKNGEMRSREDLANEILNIVKESIGL